MSIEKEHKKYMDFCEKYEEKIESCEDILSSFLSEIPRDATLYMMDDTIDKAIKSIEKIDEWIKGTKQLSKEDFKRD